MDGGTHGVQGENIEYQRLWGKGGPREADDVECSQEKETKAPTGKGIHTRALRNCAREQDTRRGTFSENAGERYSLGEAFEPYSKRGWGRKAWGKRRLSKAQKYACISNRKEELADSARGKFRHYSANIKISFRRDTGSDGEVLERRTVG